MSQTTVTSTQVAGLAGQVADHNPAKKDTFTNNCAQIVEVTITAASIATTTVTIDGNAVTYSGGATETKAEIATALLAAINADSTVGAIVTAEAGSGTDKVKVVADVTGTAFTAVGTANCSVATLIANQTTIPYGKYVVFDDDEPNGDKAHLPSASAEVTAGLISGFTIREEVVESPASGSTPAGYPHKSAMSVLREGPMWVDCETACVVGQSVYIRFTASGSLTVGSVRNDTDGGEAAAHPNAIFRTALSAAGLCRIEIPRAV